MMRSLALFALMAALTLPLLLTPPTHGAQILSYQNPAYLA